MENGNIISEQVKNVNLKLNSQFGSTSQHEQSETESANEQLQEAFYGNEEKNIRPRYIYTDTTVIDGIDQDKK
ncbi:hypothetical protein [Bacillus sp. V5-8f]|uniref:hypothetical protein n=1 Tax=Bacillus sp. V5-8f TaxID=2053044 RepID=UPI000C7684D8|nr:hypothetical protein [Bacillus sp. V5-8f]PLT35470.1 hypothetical protein CUU64_02335 [Bacillus sp. V5-8f]